MSAILNLQLIIMISVECGFNLLTAHLPCPAIEYYLADVPGKYYIAYKPLS